MQEPSRRAVLYSSCQLPPMAHVIEGIELPTAHLSSHATASGHLRVQSRFLRVSAPSLQYPSLLCAPAAFPRSCSVKSPDTTAGFRLLKDGCDRLEPRSCGDRHRCIAAATCCLFTGASFSSKPPSSPLAVLTDAPSTHAELRKPDRVAYGSSGGPRPRRRRRPAAGTFALRLSCLLGRRGGR